MVQSPRSRPRTKFFPFRAFSLTSNQRPCQFHTTKGKIGNLKKQERKINDTHKASHCLIEGSFFLCHSKNNSHFHYRTHSLQNLFSLILQFFPCTQFFHHLKVFEKLILLKHLERPFYCWLCLVTWPLRE